MIKTCVTLIATVLAVGLVLTAILLPGNQSLWEQPTACLSLGIIGIGLLKHSHDKHLLRVKACQQTNPQSA